MTTSALLCLLQMSLESKHASEVTEGSSRKTKSMPRLSLFLDNDRTKQGPNMNQV